MAVSGPNGGRVLFDALRNAIDDYLLSQYRQKKKVEEGANFLLGPRSFLGKVTDNIFLKDEMAKRNKRGQPRLPAGLVAVIGKGGTGKTTFLQNCYENMQAAGKYYFFSGEPILQTNHPAMLSIAWLVGDLLLAIDPKSKLGNIDPLTGQPYDRPILQRGDVVYVDSLTDLINYTSLGATTGGYGRDLGELYHALQWAAYITGIMIVGTVNPYTANDDHFQFVFGSLENRVLMTVVLGDLQATGSPLSSYPVFGGSPSNTPPTRTARVYLRDVARGTNALNVEIG